jgi:hypothetical protein
LSDLDTLKAVSRKIHESFVSAIGSDAVTGSVIDHIIVGYIVMRLGPCHVEILIEFGSQAFEQCVQFQMLRTINQFSVMVKERDFVGLDHGSDFRHESSVRVLFALFHYRFSHRMSRVHGTVTLLELSLKMMR